MKFVGKMELGIFRVSDVIEGIVRRDVWYIVFEIIDVKFFFFLGYVCVSVCMWKG